MPGTNYRGLAAKFGDAKFAWKVFGFNIMLGLMITTIIVWNLEDVREEDAFKKVQVVNILQNENISSEDKCSSNLITWNEFKKHSCENENLWIIIDNKVYDVWPWATTYHPGGSIICMGAGQDSSEVFHSIHSINVVMNYLPQFCIGYIKDIPK